MINILTEKQSAFFTAIIEAIRSTGEFPGYAELRHMMEFKSPNSVTQNLKALEKKGRIERRVSKGKRSYWVITKEYAPLINSKNVQLCPHCGNSLLTQNGIEAANNDLYHRKRTNNSPFRNRAINAKNQ